MFPFDPAALPRLTTRKALLVVDLQHDFLSADDGALPVSEPQGFVARTFELAGAVRAADGDVVWVGSRFEERRDDDAEPLVASDAALAARPSNSHHARVRPPAAAQRNNKDDVDNDETEPDEEAFLSHAPPRCVRPATQGVELAAQVRAAVEQQHPTDSTLWKSRYSAFNGTSLLRLLRAKMVMEVFICGSLANVGVYATALDAAGHGMAITVVDDCCGFRVAARKRKALRNLEELTGCDIAQCADVVKALRPSPSRSLSPRPSPPRAAAKAKKQPVVSAAKTEGGRPGRAAAAEADLVRRVAGLQLADPSPGAAQPRDAAPAAEADSQTSQDAQPKVREPVGNDDETTRAETGTKGEDGLNGAGVDVAATPPAHHHPATKAASAASPTTATPQPAQSASTPPSHPDTVPPAADPATMAGPEDKTIAAESASDHSDDDEQHGTQHSPQKSLGAGDTDIIDDLLPPELEATMFERLRDEVQWQRMSHQGGEVPRLVAVQGQVTDDDGGSMPVYRHPSDESPPLLPFSPAVLAVKAEAEKHLGHPLNHVLIQYYRDGNDYISEHSDKTLDIVRGSYIANVSLGAERTMVLRTKRPHKDPSRQAAAPPADGGSASQPAQPAPEATTTTKRQAQRLRLHHNSLCRMGLATNEQWLHAIRQDRRAPRDKTPAELARAGARISLTFRRIGTFLSRDESLVWGQGATGKTRAAARPVVNGQGPEAVAMLRAFGAENHASRFDWHAHYGAGFDVLHITSAPRFFASATDRVVNMRVALMLAEYGVGYAKGSMAPSLGTGSTGSTSSANGGEEAPAVPVPVKFVDNDAAKSVVQGDVAIMLYLDAVYGPRRRGEDGTPPPSASQSQLAAQYTLFQRALQLLDTVRRHSIARDDVGTTTTTTTTTTTDAPPPLPRPVRHELSTTWDPAAAADGGALWCGGRGEATAASLADFALWPVLHALVDAHGGAAAAFAGLDHLRRYYEAFAERDGTRKVLGRPATSTASTTTTDGAAAEPVAPAAPVITASS